MADNILFICGSPNQTTQMHQISEQMAEYSCFFTPYYTDGLEKLAGNLGLLNASVLGGQHRIEHVARETDFSGIVSIFQADSPLYEQVFGYRDIPNQVPHSPATRFGIASGTKFFTALGVGRLIDQCWLTLETQVGELSRAHAGFIAPEATIRHLLTHTSGIYDYFDEEVEQDFDHFFVSIPWYRLKTPTDYWPLFEGQAAKFQPGERFSYSNGGYVFLAILIGKISGQLFRDFMQEQVFQAAHMPQTGFYAMNNLPANTALGYLEDRQTTNIYNLPIRGGGDGGLFTTAADLRSLWQHLFSNRLLFPELTAVFLQTHARFNETSGYGCGVYKRLDDVLFSIVSGDAGVGFGSRYFVHHNITASLLSNVTNGGEDLHEVVVDFFNQKA